MITLEDRFDSMFFRLRKSLSGSQKKKRSSSANSVDKVQNEESSDEDNYINYDFRKFGYSTRRNRLAQAAVKFDKTKRGTSLRTRRSLRKLHNEGKLELLKDDGPIVTIFQGTQYNELPKGKVVELKKRPKSVNHPSILKNSTKKLENNENANSFTELAPYPAAENEEEWSLVLRGLEKSLVTSIQHKTNLRKQNSDSLEALNKNLDLNNHLQLIRQYSVQLSSLDNPNNVHLLEDEQRQKPLRFEQQNSSLHSLQVPYFVDPPPRPPPPLSFESLIGLNHTISGISESNTQFCKPTQTLQQPDFGTTYFPINETAAPVILQRRNRYGGYVPPNLENNRDSIGLWSEQPITTTSEIKIGTEGEDFDINVPQHSNFESGYSSNGTTSGGGGGGQQQEKEESPIFSPLPSPQKISDVWPTQLATRKLGNVNSKVPARIYGKMKKTKIDNRSEESDSEKNVHAIHEMASLGKTQEILPSSDQKKSKNKLGSLNFLKIFSHQPTNNNASQKQKRRSNKNRFAISPKSLQSLNVDTSESENLKVLPWWQNKRHSPKSLQFSELSKSEPHLYRFASASTLLNGFEAIEYLRSRIKETKYVTAVFESSNDGLASILGDITREFIHWLGPSSRLLAVACEVHWSVPERYRSRVVEIKMKDSLHRALRDNNHRVLNLYDECKSYLPLSLIESKVEESCARESEIDAFQGIYRRYYPDLLSLQDPTTIVSHKSYWTLENLSDETRAPLVPKPEKFLHRSLTRDQLSRRSIVAVNMATLRLVDDLTDYDEERPNATSQNILI